MQGIKGPGDGARERPTNADATATPSSPSPHATLLLPPLAVLGASPRRRGDARGGRVSQARDGRLSRGRHATLHDDRDEDGIVVAVCAPPRELPTVKSTSWPADREWIREDAPEDADECVLARDGSQGGECLVEGLTNNLFVVVERTGRETAGSNRARGECLPGLARAAVLATCETEGIAVEARARRQRSGKVERGLRHKRRAPGEADRRGDGREGWADLSGRGGRRWAGSSWWSSQNARDRSRSGYSSGWWRRRTRTRRRD